MIIISWAAQVCRDRRRRVSESSSPRFKVGMIQLIFTPARSEFVSQLGTISGSFCGDGRESEQLYGLVKSAATDLLPGVIKVVRASSFGIPRTLRQRFTS